MLVNKNQPKWGHLKLLHELLKSMEDVLTQGTTNHTDYGNLLTVSFCVQPSVYMF